MLYVVQVVDAEECTLRMHPDYSDDATNVAFPTARLGRRFRMAYSVVYLNVQDRTIRDEPVVLWDTLRGSRVHKYITLRHFIMGLQRVVDPAQLKIASYDQEKAFLGTDVPKPERLEEDWGAESDEEASEPEEEEQPAKRRRA